MSHTTLHKLYTEQGQAPWLDNISRQMINSGGLQKMIDDGIVGVTSNPTIFEKAMASGNAYDEQIKELVSAGKNTRDVFLGLMVKDIADAADIFLPINQATNGLDGFISIEVTPDLAANTQSTIEQARIFRDELARPNVLVKVPATREGIPAIKQLISEGISINVTLIFSLERYQQVIDAYIEGIEARAAAGEDLTGVRSVASFFVSRVDSNIDKKLQAKIDATDDADEKAKLQGLMGKAAVANAKLAYQIFLRNFSGARWEKLAAQGANVQRPLWASTSTKNPSYPDTLYVDELIGPDTVNTMPNNTIEAFLDHGTVARTIDSGLAEAQANIDALEAAGISMKTVTQELEDEGVASFAKSFDSLSASLQTKIDELQASLQGAGSGLGGR